MGGVPTSLYLDEADSNLAAFKAPYACVEQLSTQTLALPLSSRMSYFFVGFSSFFRAQLTTTSPFFRYPAVCQVLMGMLVARHTSYWCGRSRVR